MTITERRISTEGQIGAPVRMPDGREHSGVLHIAPSQEFSPENIADEQQAFTSVRGEPAEIGANTS